MRIVQVVACWFGWRRAADPRQGPDPLLYLRYWGEALRNLRHDLITETVFVFSGPVAFGAPELVAEMPGARWIARPNQGLSYGAYSDAYAGAVTGPVDRWVLCEDDYVPAVDDYDAIMSSLLDAAGPRCGFCCAKLGPTVDGRPHASVFIGMLPDAALRAAANARGGRLPVPDGGEYNHAEISGQIGWSLLLQDCGWSLSEWHPGREVVFWEDKVTVFPGAAPALFVPVQTIRKDPPR